MKHIHITILILLFCLFYIGLHISFLEGALFERENNICVSNFSLNKIQESTVFFDKIYQMQQIEVVELRKKVEEQTKNLSSCYHKNSKLQEEINLKLL